MNQLLYFAAHPLRTWANIRYRMPRGASDKRHVFIVGVPRSGTTLLKTLLVAHPKLGGNDYESTGVFGFRDIFQYRIGELKPGYVRQLLDQSGDIVAFYDRLVASLLERSGKQVFVDKLQVHSYRIAYVQRHFPNAAFLHIVRDGRDCYCSALRHPNVRQSDSLARFAAYWARSVSLPEKIIAPDRLFTVRYEDLTADAEASMANLMDFLGIDFVEHQIAVEHYSATTSMKRRKVHENLGRPINAKSQGRWRRELSEKDNTAFRKLAGEALAKFGYDDDEPLQASTGAWNRGLGVQANGEASNRQGGP